MMDAAEMLHTQPETLALTTADGSTFADAERIRRALEFLQEHYAHQPSLEQAAKIAGLSPYHFQRQFSRQVGVSPKKFVQYLTLDHAKLCLQRADSVLDAAYDSGLSGPGRLHDLFVVHEAMTPGQWKARGRGLTLRYGWHDSPFGDCLILASDQGVCGMAFAAPGRREPVLSNLASQFGAAAIIADDGATAGHAARAFGRDAGPLTVVLRGTPFQLKIWEALLRIPPGAVTTYRRLAASVDQAQASRAVGRACALNPISWLIPCHRVLRASGSLAGFRWGDDRKRMMLAWEGARADAEI